MSITNYRDFVIFAEEVKNAGKDAHGRPEKFSLRIFDSPVGEGQYAEELIIDDWDTIEEWRKQLAIRKIKPDDFEKFTRKLGSLILPPHARDLYKRSLLILENEQKDEGLRVRLRLPQSLAYLPWEYALIELHGETTPPVDFWALDWHISIVRHEAIDRPAAPFGSSATRRLIFAMASPEGEGWQPLNLVDEQNMIREQLDNVHGLQAEYHPDFQREDISKGITQDEIHELLMDHPADIFYFSGHGKFSPDAQNNLGRGAIILAGEHNTPKEVQADILSSLLTEGHIRLVILDACESGKRDLYQEWNSVATALLKGGIPAVVAMQFSIYDDLAKEFSRTLYWYLVAGLNIDEVVAQGRNAAYRADPKQRDWGSPVLYMRNAGGNIFPPITDEQVRIEAVRISEQDATLSKALMSWTRKDILASPAQLEVLMRDNDSMHFTPVEAVLLLRSAVEHDLKSNDWVELLRKVGKEWLEQTQNRGVITAKTELDLAEKRLGLEAQILNPAPDTVGNLTWSAVTNVNEKTAQTAALALLALEPDSAIDKIQAALRKGISDFGLQRKRRAMLFGAIAEADPKFAANIPQDRTAVWWWRFCKHVHRDRSQIMRWCLGGAFGGALALAILRGFLAIFNSQPTGSEFAVNSYWGFILGFLLVLGIVMASPLLLQNPAAPELGRKKRLDILAILLGGLGFSLGNGLVAWMMGLGISLAMFVRFALTTFCSGVGLSLGLFRQPAAGWRMGAGGWLKRLALAGFILAFLQTPVLCEAATKPGGGYWLDNAQWTVSAITESSQLIINKYSLHPSLKSLFDQCIPVETGKCCFNCTSPGNRSPGGGFFCNCLAQWWSVLDAALVGVVLTLGITAGMHFPQTWLYRLWKKLKARLGGI